MVSVGLGTSVTPSSWYRFDDIHLCFFTSVLSANKMIFFLLSRVLKQHKDPTVILKWRVFAFI